MLGINTERQNDQTQIQLVGQLCRADAEKHTKALLHSLAPKTSYQIDLSAISKIDTFGTASLAAFARKAQACGSTVQFKNAPPHIQQVLDGFLWSTQESPKALSFADRLENIGNQAVQIFQSLKAFLYLVSDTFVWSIAGAARTQRVRKGAVWLEATRIGLDALGIVCLIAFLVGSVVALQAASILRMFGADILVADMIGISMTREMAPLMSAILMAGRSGASIAAQIATMNINEEISGLRTMGLEPIKYVVVPKFRAITLTMPGLTIFATVCGIFGGFIVAILYMELGITAFLHQLANALYVKDILVSLLKSIVFAWLIVCIAAHKGFQAYGGSDSVGKVTTSSVVASIFWCIVADAVFSLVFYF